MKNPLNKPFAGVRVCARKGSWDKGNKSVNIFDKFEINSKESRAVSPIFQALHPGSGASGRFFCALKTRGKRRKKVCNLRVSFPIPIHNIDRGDLGYALIFLGSGRIVLIYLYDWQRAWAGRAI